MKIYIAIILSIGLACKQGPNQRLSPLLSIRNGLDEPIIQFFDEYSFGDTLTARLELQPWCGYYPSLIKPKEYFKDAQFTGFMKPVMGRVFIFDDRCVLRSDNSRYDGYTDLVLWDFKLDVCPDSAKFFEALSKETLDEPRIVLYRNWIDSGEKFYHFGWINYSFMMGHIAEVLVSDKRGIVGIRMEDIASHTSCSVGEFTKKTE